MSYQVKVGICDIDSYNMIFYSNYLKYNERAAYHVIGECRIQNVRIIKYLRSVQWESNVCIESHILSTNENTVDLLHVWLCDGKPMNQSVIKYAVPKYCREKIGEIPRLSKFLFHEWRKNAGFTPDGMTHSIETPFYSDMCGMGGTMSNGTCLDLMERQRTELIGGQPVLHRLKVEEGILIVVVNIYDLRFGDAVLDVGDTITCESTGEFAEDNKSIMVRQNIRRGDDMISDGVVKLCFIREGKGVELKL